MQRFRPTSSLMFAIALATLVATGCGTTRSTDTTRTATEQLLVSDAIDRALLSMDLRTLSGQSVYLDDSKLADTVDKNYLISSMRQYLLANGCSLREKREDADFVVEARAGAVGTDRSELLFGLPSMNVPQIALVQPVAAVIPEIPIAKRKDQRGIAKIAVFAYHRQTGAPVWQSGLVHEESSSNDVWILGAGPFQRGTIYAGTEFAGKPIRNEQEEAEKADAGRRLPPVDLLQANTFRSPKQFAKQAPPADQKVAQAVHTEPATAAAVPAPPAAKPPKQAAPAATTTAADSSAPQSAPATTTPKPAATSATPKPNGLSAAADASKLQSPQSAYLQPVDAATLPQPRFNSPQ